MYVIGIDAGASKTYCLAARVDGTITGFGQALAGSYEVAGIEKAKENILASVEEQCDWLRRIGYQDVDCFLKTFELALFGGRKAARPREKPLARESPGLCQRGQENRMPTGCVSAI